MARELRDYRRKRDPAATPEPFGSGRGGGRPAFVVQRHSARRLHYDFRLERDGALASWAVPKGIPLRPGDKALAVHVEDHPLDYATFAGRIPAGQYGAGTVEIWDHGTYELVEDKPDGGLTVRLAGERLRGLWTLVPAHLGGEERNWLLIRKREPGEPAPGPAEPPRRYAPMLAALVDDLPTGDAWAFEIKWDGYRALTRLSGGDVEMWSRGGKDLGERFAPVRRRLARAIRTPDCVLDGEVCALDPDGVPRFGLLQRGEGAMVYYLFDLLEADEEPLLERPWSERRARLRDLVVADDPVVRLSEDFPDGEALRELARARGLEGVVAKRRASPYRPGGRGPDWRKRKERTGQEFLIGGYTAGKGSRGAVGALMLGVWGDEGLLWVGNVGSGLTEAELGRLRELMARLERRDSPFVNEAHGRTARERVTWVEPELVCQVRFAEWTAEGRLRAPVYLGLRDDVDPAAVRHERPAPAPDPPPAPRRRLRLTNLDKVFFPDEGITKGDLVDYYRAVAPALVPHLRDRPFTMIRRPDGIAGEHFFQKDRPPHMPEWIPVAELPSGTEAGARVIRFPLVNEPDAVVWMVNAGCIDMNAWYARADEPERPDFVLFDLDPSEGSGFAEAARVALLVRDALDLMGLRSYPKTSSARGLHVMVPIDRGPRYAEVRQFCSVVAGALEATHRGLVTTQWAKSRRRGVLIDANQIGYGKTISSVYSVRPRPGAPVSTPLRWEEVDEGLDPRALTMEVVRERVERHGDLFGPVLQGGQALGPALALLRGDEG